MKKKMQTFLEQEKLKCPRCDSTNTKFCYYNNYNLSQPRHFCKSCRRYWTKGGVLRNIPVGGGSRKNVKRGSSAAAASKRSPPPEEKNETSLAPKGESSGEGQFGDFAELGGNREASPALKLDDFRQGQFRNLAEVSGSLTFDSLLVGSSGRAQFGGLLDGLGPIGLSLQTSDLLYDPGSGQNVDPQPHGFLNTGGGDGGRWGGGWWPDFSV